MRKAQQLKWDTVVLLLFFITTACVLRGGKIEYVDRAILDIPQPIYEHITTFHPGYSDEQIVDYFDNNKKALYSLYRDEL